MKKRKLLTWSEAKVDKILRRRLPPSTYRVLVAVRLGDAIGTDPGEKLPEAEFQFLTRAHLDFLIVKNSYPSEPVVAVEFDGPHHDDPVQVSRDVLKNRLCQKSDLPLIRIRGPEIEEHDQVTVLDYIIDRFLAWQRESPGIMEEIRDYAASLDPVHLDQLIADGDPSLDPSFEFSLRHPFPGTQKVKARLLHRYGIATLDTPPRLRSKTRLLCDVEWAAQGPGDDEQFYTASRKVIVKRLDASADDVVFSAIRSASIRSWLPTDLDIPSPPDLPSLFQGHSAQEVNEIGDLWMKRINNMWFPALPGFSAWDIAENLAEYLAFMVVEDWAVGAANIRMNPPAGGPPTG